MDAIEEGRRSAPVEYKSCNYFLNGNDAHDDVAWMRYGPMRRWMSSVPSVSLRWRPESWQRCCCCCCCWTSLSSYNLFTREEKKHHERTEQVMWAWNGGNDSNCHVCMECGICCQLCCVGALCVRYRHVFVSLRPRRVVTLFFFVFGTVYKSSLTYLVARSYECAYDRAQW